MNKARRKILSDLLTQIIKIKDELEDLKSGVESEGESERESFDNLSEGLQQADNGQKIEAAATELEQAVSSVDDAINCLNDAVTSIEAATE